MINPNVWKAVRKNQDGNGKAEVTTQRIWTQALPLPTLNFRAYLVLKRWMDILGALALIVLTLPVMLLIAVAIKLDSPGPIIFRQERVGARVRGKGGKKSWEVTGFTIFKFRTMKHNVSSESHKQFMAALIKGDEDTLAKLNGGKLDEKNKYKMVNDDRITRVGKLLRKTSLDELPQLFNVLRGEMSLVGPRPAIAYEIDMMPVAFLERLAAKPGFTGWWQVEGRSQVEFDKMVAMDVWYIHNANLWLDLEILFKTPFAVLQSKGAA
ncbi:MAG: sugar transferase [Anaerolineae bacterium]|nr:sugar transferase [Anaerolineae bacterium]